MIASLIPKIVSDRKKRVNARPISFNFITRYFTVLFRPGRFDEISNQNGPKIKQKTKIVIHWNYLQISVARSGIIILWTKLKTKCFVICYIYTFAVSIFVWKFNFYRINLAFCTDVFLLTISQVAILHRPITQHYLTFGDWVLKLIICF